jgi:hypothetical protein
VWNTNGGAPAGLDLVANHAYCASGVSVDNTSSGFGYSLVSCEKAVKANPKCAAAGDFFTFGANYNGQCKCPTDACAKRGSNSAYAIYKLDPSAAAKGINVTLDVRAIHSSSPVQVYDVWKSKIVGTADSTFTATDIPIHGTAFFRLSAMA